MKLNSFESVLLRAPEDTSNPGTGNPAVPEATTPPMGPDLTKLLEQVLTPIAKSISDMRKEFQEADTRTNLRIKTVIDDLVSAQLDGPSNPPPPVPASTPAPTPVQTPPPIVEDMSKMQVVGLSSKLKQEQEQNRQNAARIEELVRDNRRTKIEAAISGAMSKLPWAADAVQDLVSSQMAAAAEVDADGKVKINGAEPLAAIKAYHAANAWAQPALPNSGSGNPGGVTRRPGDNSVDLRTYDPAKIDPNGEEFKRLLAQTRQQFGVGS